MGKFAIPEANEEPSIGEFSWEMAKRFAFAGLVALSVVNLGVDVVALAVGQLGTP